MVTEDPRVTSALSTHRKGTLLYAVAWIAIGAAVLLLALDIALLLSSLTSSSSGASAPSQAVDLTLGSLGLLGAGIALRGVAFALMMRGDFLLRSRIPPRLGSVR